MSDLTEQDLAALDPVGYWQDKYETAADEIERLTAGRDIQKGNAERWEALAMQYKREIERLTPNSENIQFMENQNLEFQARVEMLEAALTWFGHGSLEAALAVATPSNKTQENDT